VDRWDEPDWGAEDGLHEKPVTIAPSLTVSGLTAGRNYRCLRFDSASSVPNGNFASGSFSFEYAFTASKSSEVRKDLDTFESDATIFYRCVAA
jgi:hypothetical protein